MGGWRCRLTLGMKVWIGHLVSPIRPTLCPQPSLSGQQTNTATSPTLLQHYNPRHLYSWLFEQRYNVLRLLRRPRCIIPGDSIATFGFRRSETWVTRSSAKWQINNAADPSSQLGQQLFLSFIQEQGKLTSLAAINQSCCFSFAFLGDSIISSRWKLDKYFKINEKSAQTKTNDKSSQVLNIAKGTTDPRVEFILPK